MKPSRLQKLVFYSFTGIIFIGIGLGPGILWGKAHRAAHARAEQQLVDASAAGSRQLQELPPAGSPEAAQLLADENTAEYVSTIYTYLNDAAVISRNSTAAFLQELQRWQQASQPNSTLDVAPFVAVARDMLGYFRLRYSEALLVLLRQFSESGVLVPTAVNPDVLQQEVQQLLDTANLNRYYAAVSSGCGQATQRGFVTDEETVSYAADAATGVTQVKVTGRRLLQQQLAELPGARRSRRHHQHSSAAMGTSIRPPFLGAIYASSAANSTAFAATAAGAVHRRAEYYSRSRHLQQQSSLSGTFQDTICLVPTANWPVDGPQDITFSCPDMQQRPKLAGFQPAEMPVVFHCLRYPSEDGRHVLPAIERPQEAAQNLIDVANKHFEGSGLSFKMQEVRTDAAKYPYLLLHSLSKWQECSINNNNKQLEQKGLECLSKAAAQPSVVILASQLVINVIISSSPHRPSCSGEQDITCNHTIWGYAQADGPWFNAGTADPNYQEGDSAGNWLWLRFTELDVGGRNNANVWEAGGNTFAHELAHYLALMHTHQGGCEGAQPGKGDGVADTAQQDWPQQPPQQQQQQQLQRRQQQQQQQQQQLGYYLTGGDSDQWTWDDDYNPAVRAKVAAAAQQLPPTPRQQMLAQQAAAASQQLPTVINRLPEQFNAQVLSNAVLLIDKPARWSSTDVVRELQRTLKLQKVCHGGPLDAHATGLLIVLMGAASRLTPKLEPLERTYSGTIKLGAATTTYDATGQVVTLSPAWRQLSDADVAAAAAAMQGEVLQVPCMWSSTKYKNRPLRWYAERGEEVRREPKAVQISSIQVWRDKASPASDSSSSSSPTAASDKADVAGLQLDAAAAGSDEVHFRVVAGKGASMRVLAHDLGAALGCGAHLLSLRREAIGGFKVDTAWSLEVLLPLAKKYGKGFKFAPQA
ncbi:hypothetical protein OEZ86_013709 [Tetradesmus obliquus]|nr:hypothetical protein OEZ86_013709 [Tetradesmus obliquus]